jgi:ABC-type Fe3+ transport system substrate-binding protein
MKNIGLDKEEEKNSAPEVKKVIVPSCEKEKTEQNVPLYNYHLTTSEKGFELRTNDDINTGVKKPYFISIVPKIFQKNFQKLFLNTFPSYTESNNNEVVFFNGSIYADNILYDYIDTIDSTEQLPDILFTNDFNSVYHRCFMDSFLNYNNFENPYLPMNTSLAESKAKQHSQLLNILAYDALVMVIRRPNYNSMPIPREWYELLNPKLNNKIIVPGYQDFFCNTLYFHFVKDFGYQAIEHLAKNSCVMIHPEKMVEMINSGIMSEVSVFVMPYSYVRKIENKIDYKVIIPDDGAIAIPIQMMVKKGAYEKYPEIIDFLTGEELGAEFEKCGFFSTSIRHKNPNPIQKMNWIGWEFLEGSDIKEVKENIRKIIFSEEI